MLALSAADLVGVFFETYLYGLFCILFLTCTYAFARHPSSRASPFLILATVIIFTLSTIHLALDLRRITDGFSLTMFSQANPLDVGQDLYAACYVSKQRSRLNVASVWVYTVNNLLTDLVMIWRCFVVWGNNAWVCSGPLVFLLATTACGFVSTHFLTRVQGFEDGTVDAEAIARHATSWGKAAFTLTLATNVICTALIAGRIISQKRLVRTTLGGQKPTSPFYYTSVVAVLVDSGVLYSVALIVQLGLYFGNNTALFVGFDIISQLMGIGPVLVILYYILGRTTDSASASTLPSSRFRPTHKTKNSFASPPDVAVEMTPRSPPASPTQRQVNRIPPPGIDVNPGYAVHAPSFDLARARTGSMESLDEAAEERKKAAGEL